MIQRFVADISRDAMVNAIGEIWRSAADPSLWERALASVNGMIPECRGMVIFTPFSQGGGGSLWQTLDAPEGFLDDYIANWQGRDVSIHTIARRMPAEKIIFELMDIIPEPGMSEFWQKLYRPYGLEDMSLLAVNGMKADSVETAVLGAFATERHGKLVEARRQVFSAIEDHLLGAIALHWRLVRAESSASVSNSLLERIALGTVILSASRKILYMNTAARRMIDSADAVVMRGTQIEAVDSTAQQHMEKAMAAILRGGAERPFLLPRKSGGVVTAIMSPTEAGIHLGDVGKSAAILFLSDPGEVARGAGRRLAELYGLTKAEAEIAQAIAEGRDVEEIASQRAITISTVRTHLKSVMAKIGASRQSDVVRAVLATAIL